MTRSVDWRIERRLHQDDPAGGLPHWLWWHRRPGVMTKWATLTFAALAKLKEPTRLLLWPALLLLTLPLLLWRLRWFPLRLCQSGGTRADVAGRRLARGGGPPGGL